MIWKGKVGSIPTFFEGWKYTRCVNFRTSHYTALENFQKVNYPIAGRIQIQPGLGELYLFLNITVSTVYITYTIFVFLLLNLFIFESEQGRGRNRGDRERLPSRLCTVSTEPHMGLEHTN